MKLNIQLSTENHKTDLWILKEIILTFLIQGQNRSLGSNGQT